jgi:hypothetical protein
MSALAAGYVFLSYKDSYALIKGCPSGAEEAAGKIETGQVPQGLKPIVFSIVYGPTKVVP